MEAGTGVGHHMFVILSQEYSEKKKQLHIVSFKIGWSNSLGVEIKTN